MEPQAKWCPKQQLIPKTKPEHNFFYGSATSTVNLYIPYLYWGNTLSQNRYFFKDHKMWDFTASVLTHNKCVYRLFITKYMYRFSGQETSQIFGTEKCKNITEAVHTFTYNNDNSA